MHIGKRRVKGGKKKLTIDSTVWIGNHLSDALSNPYWSSPGGWRMEMQRIPSGYTRSRGRHMLTEGCWMRGILTVGVPHGSEELHRWWQERILGGEGQPCLENASFTVNRNSECDPEVTEQ